MQPRTRSILGHCLGAMPAPIGVKPTKAPIDRLEGTILSAWRLFLHNQASDRPTIGLFALMRIATLGYTLVILLPNEVLGVLGLW